MTKDLAAAVDWYEKALAAGNKEAEKPLEAARKALRAQREEAELQRIRAMNEARDTSMEVGAIIAGVLCVVFMFVESYTVGRVHGPGTVLEIGAIAAVAVLAAVAGTCSIGSLSEPLGVPGGIAGFLAGISVAILNASPADYPHIKRTVMIAVAVIILIMLVQIIIKKGRPKP